jgi:hypothetical protein
VHQRRTGRPRAIAGRRERFVIATKFGFDIGFRLFHNSELDPAREWLSGEPVPGRQTKSVEQGAAGIARDASKPDVMPAPDGSRWGGSSFAVSQGAVYASYPASERSNPWRIATGTQVNSPPMAMLTSTSR